jgi:1,4-alpha-glucan branching enzyme
LLHALYELRDQGYQFRLTLGFTPTLLEQLKDPLVLQHLEEFITEKIARAQADVVRFERLGEGQLLNLALFYRERYQRILRCFKQGFEGDLIAALRRLQNEGYVEVVASAATHAYLPLLQRDSSIYGQLKAGVECYQRHFGVAPRSLWLPECGYRPPFYFTHNNVTYIKKGVESFLAELGVGCFFAETHTVEGGEPVGKAMGDVIGPYGNIPKRYVVPSSEYVEPTQKTTYLPYWVQSAEVAVLGRNDRTGMQVWSADWGYPGDYHYREFHKKDGVSGLHYWKVSGAKVNLAEKELYDPYGAAQQVAEHSAHYAHLVAELLHRFYEESGKFGIIVAAYDTELLGHWWFEGVDWLKQVLAHLCHSEVVELTTASEFIANHPPHDVLALPEGSWGQAGGHFTWLNVDTEWMWGVIHAAELEMEGLVAEYPDAEGVLREVLNQAARELLLLQSSDWAFLITTGQAREYATARFSEHVERFQLLAQLAKCSEMAKAAQLCEELWERDKLFPEVDYRWFGEREGR